MAAQRLTTQLISLSVLFLMLGDIMTSYVPPPCNEETSSGYCLNGGSCFSVRGVMHCRCAEDYEGDRCENRAEFLAEPTPCTQPQFCLNGGSCFLIENHRVCRCADGFDGTRCQRRVETSVEAAPCSEPMSSNYCLNGGSCFSVGEESLMYCRCARPYAGKRCELKQEDP